MRHFGERWQRFPAEVAVCLVAGSLSGCLHHKKPPPPVVLPAPTPVALATPPTPAKPPMVEAPKQKLPDVPVAAAAATKPKKPRRKPKSAAQTAQGTGSGTGATPGAQAGGNASGSTGATNSAGGSGAGSAGAGSAGGPQVASAEPPPAEAGIAALGALTPGGGDQSPRARQEAADLIAATEKRMNALPKDTVKAQAAQINKVRNFLREAQSALRSGDAEGARTLAVKGKLLLDDVEKAGGG